MKKLYLFPLACIFFLLFSGCSKHDITPDPEPQPSPNAYEISLETAVDQAIRFMDQIYPETRSSSSSNRIDARTIYRTTPTLTRGEEAIEIPLHVIQFLSAKEDPAGYVVMVGDTRMKEPVMVFSDENRWDLSGVPEFEKFFFASVDQFIAETLEGREECEGCEDPPIDERDCWDGIEYREATQLYEIPHKLTWNQNPDPYNRYMPLCATGGSGGKMFAGCATIAVGQIFAHYQRPVSGGGYTWNYSLMTSMPEATGLSETGKEHVARYVKYVGDLIGVSYGCGGSIANTSQVSSALFRAGYNYGSYRAFDRYTVFESLKQKQPVFMRGANSEGAGHFWVIEGARRVSVWEETWDICEPDFEPIFIGDELVATNDFQYYNIGHGGSGDGWYQITYHNTIGGRNGMYKGYSYELGIIPNIRPR